MDTRSSVVTCEEECSGEVEEVEIGGDGGNLYLVAFSVEKGNGKLQKATVGSGNNIQHHQGCT